MRVHIYTDSGGGGSPVPLSLGSKGGSGRKQRRYFVCKWAQRQLVYIVRLYS